MKNALIVSGLIALTLVACGKTQEELAADAERADAMKVASAAKLAPVVAADAAPAAQAGSDAATPAAAPATAPAAEPTAAAPAAGSADKAKE
ncbi:MAG: hypothetical protein K9J42_06095 [Sulfuritalea sp.]|nr:hypothetical protein [Sulfuritalea sp.]